MELSYWISALAGRLDGLKKIASGYQFRCLYCGDSQKKVSKTRGYLLEKWGKCFLKCHNCGLSKPLEKFLMDQHPELHQEYVKQMCSPGRPEGAPAHLQCQEGANPSAIHHLPRGGAAEYQSWQRGMHWSPAHLYRGRKKRLS